MNKKKGTTRYKINTDFVVQKVGQKVTIFDATSAKIYSLNATALQIYSGIQLGWDTEMIVDKIQEKYTVDRDTVTKDFDECMQFFKEKRIIIPIKI